MVDPPYSAKIHVEYEEWLSIECTACAHSVNIRMTEIPREDIAKVVAGKKRFRCSKCGATKVETRRHWQAPELPKT